MSFSLHTLSAFSRALRAIYSTDEKPPLGLTVRWETSGERADDLLYLDELLATHRRALAPPPDRAATATATAQANNRNDAHDFFRLRGAGLTPRECEILFWVAEGKHDSEIGIIVSCASKTVSKHVENILAKLHAETRLAATHTALAWLKQNR